jgi:hypothetical protein
MQLLDEANARDRAYIYRIEGNKKIKPAVYKGQLFPRLEEYIRDNFVPRDKDGYGIFYIMIRRGETMLLSGTIALELPLSQRRA